MSHSPGAGAEELPGMAENEAFRLRDMTTLRSKLDSVTSESITAIAQSFRIWSCREKQCNLGKRGWNWTSGMRLAGTREIRVALDTLVRNGQYCW